MMELHQAEHEHGTLESGATNDRHPRAWRAFGVFSKLIIVALLALSAASLLLPFASRAMLNSLSFLPLDWLLNQNGSWILGAGLFALLVLFLAIKRFQLVGDRRLWQDAGCPQCLENELVRVPRKQGDRWYSLIALPAFRYACRNCTWQGLRIARRLVRPEPMVMPTTFAPAESDLSGGYRDDSFDEMALSAVAPPADMENYDDQADYGDYQNGQAASIYVFDVPENVEVDLTGEDTDGMAAETAEDEAVAPSPTMPTTATTSTTAEIDETWAPFDDELLFDDDAPLSTNPASDIHPPASGRSHEQPNNHKSNEQEDEFEWLWSRLDQDK